WSHTPKDLATGLLREHVKIVVEGLRRGGNVGITTAHDRVKWKGPRARCVGAVHEVTGLRHLEDVEVAVGNDGRKHGRRAPLVMCPACSNAMESASRMEWLCHQWSIGSPVAGSECRGNPCSPDLSRDGPSAVGECHDSDTFVTWMPMS